MSQENTKSDGKFGNEEKSVICFGTNEKPVSVMTVYNIAGETGQTYPDLPRALTCLFALKFDNYIYYAGMISNENYSKNVYEFYRLRLDGEKAGWEKLTPMNEKKWSFAAAVFQGCLVLTGGFNGKNNVNTDEAYDVQLNKWRHISSFSYRRSQHDLVVANGCLYAIGGRDENIIASVQRLDEINGEWTAVQPMNTARCYFAAIHCNGFIYAIGGFTSDTSKKYGQKRVKSVERYDPVKDEWVYVKELDHERWGYPAVWVMKGKIYLTGGCCDPESATNTINCYDPELDRWSVEDEIEHELYSRKIVTV